MKSYRALICGVSLALLLAVAGWTVVSLAGSGDLLPLPQEQQAPGHMLDPDGAQLAVDEGSGPDGFRPTGFVPRDASSPTHAFARVAVA